MNQWHHNLCKLHKELRICYKNSVKEIMDNKGIIGEVELADTFETKPFGEKGYYFKLTDGKQGSLIITGKDCRLKWGGNNFR